MELAESKGLGGKVDWRYRVASGSELGIRSDDEYAQELEWAAQAAAEAVEAVGLTDW
ncbi:hypothetical protein PM082_022888 [Marasmius tenuissimus]|nr:hypothetical protein PM082_022888 [Marasmius tenuissimus]